jgi:hypothetical protein
MAHCMRTSRHIERQRSGCGPFGSVFIGVAVVVRVRSLQPPFPLRRRRSSTTATTSRQRKSGEPQPTSQHDALVTHSHRVAAPRRTRAQALLEARHTPGKLQATVRATVSPWRCSDGSRPPSTAVIPAHETGPVEKAASTSTRAPMSARSRRATMSLSDTTLNVQRAGLDGTRGARKRQSSTAGGAGWKVGALRHLCRFLSQRLGDVVMHSAQKCHRMTGSAHTPNLPNMPIYGSLLI